eukprot:TRINITY_DN28510_c0_g1_i2.p1 TRINITY_DN28510_c0_g1~~TRINITY_DN28510_c0_g1_i2.p1  ORF type:complete len:363 (-),score=63.22 TRINITY_DN28510_c0_g1_i2:109-1197(-)
MQVQPHSLPGSVPGPSEPLPPASPQGGSCSMFTGDEGPVSVPASPHGLSFTGGAAWSPAATQEVVPPAPGSHAAPAVAIPGAGAGIRPPPGGGAAGEEIVLLQKQLDSCKDWIAKMKQSAEETQVELRRLRGKDSQLAAAQTDVASLRKRVGDLQSDVVRLDSERRRLMELNNSLRATILQGGAAGGGPGQQPVAASAIADAALAVGPLREELKAAVAAKQRSREEMQESVTRVDALEAQLHRLTLQNRHYRSELERLSGLASNAGAAGGPGGAGGAGDGKGGKGLQVTGVSFDRSPSPGGRRLPRQARDRSTDSQRAVRHRLQELHQRGQAVAAEERQAELNQRWAWMGPARGGRPGGDEA